MSLKSQTLKYTKPGVYTFTVPPGISEIEMYLWGAGGASAQGVTAVSVETGVTQIGTRVVGQEMISASATVTKLIREQRIIPGNAGYVIPGGSQVVTNPGTTTVQLPTGVTQATVVATGGGGGGGVTTTAPTNVVTNAPVVPTNTGATPSTAKTTPITQPAQAATISSVTPTNRPSVSKTSPPPAAPINNRTAKGGVSTPPPSGIRGK